ncbi:MAG TPA: tetratricopeptide repeat protein [Candidatus Acidoferrales bacterium]|nr:tetratricopeptide repeat protein [Candidatus Acidoferrales bacterium]
MNASDGQAPPRTSRRRRAIVIRREEHIGDPVGMAFLESAETNADAVMERLAEYLGKKIRIKKAEVSHDEITVEVELRGWPEEGARMAAAARELHDKGARRGAQAMYRDALELDPTNLQALAGLGLSLAEQDKFADALTTLKRAREFGADGIEITLAMARCAARLDRAAAATGYYEQVLKVEPRNFVARRGLRALGRHDATSKKTGAAVRTVRD